MLIETACAGLVLITSSENYEKESCDLNRIILYHNDIKNAKSKKTCSIHCNLQLEVH